MRKTAKGLLPLFMLLFIFFQKNKGFALSITAPATNTANAAHKLPGRYLKASEFVKLSARDFSELTGKKLNLFQRLSFGVARLRLKHDLKKNPDLKLTDYKRSDNNGRFNFLWFILGLAGPIAGLFTGALLLFALVAVAPVVIAYATKQDKTKIKSVWIGFGTGLLFILILALLVIAAFANGW
jgi:hypothetical protein